MERDKGLNPKPEPGLRNPNHFLVITMKTHIHLPAFRLASTPNKSVARAALPSPRSSVRTSVIHPLASVLGLLPAVLCLFAAAPQALAANATFAAGENHSLYVTSDGILHTMGSNAQGQGATGPTPLAAVTAGRKQSLYIARGRALYVTGQYYMDKSGIPTMLLSPSLLASNVADAAAGDSFSLYVTTSGTLYTAGNNDSGQLGDGTTTNRSSPALTRIFQQKELAPG